MLEQYKNIHTLFDIPYLQHPHPTVRQLIPTRFQPRIRTYARLTGLADIRRGADVNLHRPTSLSKEPSVLKLCFCVYAVLKASCV
jgi:hypothetical protein